jgi:hypothetical protein
MTDLAMSGIVTQRPRSAYRAIDSLAKVALLSLSVGLTSPATGQMNLFSFKTTAEFVAQCDVASLPSDCLAAIEHVEGVIDDREHPNETCDGGPEAMLKSRSGVELEAWLAERVRQIVPWLKAHREYDEKSYGDGVWAALKGVYCKPGEKRERSSR